MIRRVEQGGRKHTEARGADNGHRAGEVERASANLAIVVAGDTFVPLHHHEPAHHGNIVKAYPHHAAVGGAGGDLVTLQVWFLFVAHLAQIDGAGLMRLQIAPAVAPVRDRRGSPLIERR
jgi:hypothetical protein